MTLSDKDFKAGFDYAVDLLKRLISIPTVSPAGDHYEEAAELLARELEGLGFSVDVIRVPSDYQREKCKNASSNPRFIVLGRLGEGGPRLHFNGHYDVVPGGQGWTVTEPFKPVIKDGRLYGRGAIDMKGGIAAAMGAFKALRSAGVEPGLTIEAAWVPDEEIGGECGTGYLVERVIDPPEYVVLPEPSGLDYPWHGHKGAVWVRVYVKGRNAHASMPWHGRNAFLMASSLALELQSLIAARFPGRKSRYKFDPPDAAYPTASIGGVAGVVGGGKTNQVPGEFVFTIDRRIIPEETVEEALEEIEGMIRWAAVKTGVDYRLEVEHTMPSAINDPGELYEALRKSAEQAGYTVGEPVVCPGGLDMRYYTVKGSKSLSYGPDGSLAHAPDEHIKLDELEKLVKVFALLPLNLA
ncbi:MAG: M20 family metallopeptidase [Desulfurococcales archaeon]|nr:M20 family metallopeptidase [Desulfurococcales archaeon]